MRTGLRLRVLVSLALVMVVTVTLVSLASVGLLRHGLERQAVRNASEIAALAATVMGAAIDPHFDAHEDGNRLNLERLSELFADAAAELSVVVLDREGAIVTSSTSGREDHGLASGAATPSSLWSSTEPIERVAAGDDGVRVVTVFTMIRDDAGQDVAALRVDRRLEEASRLVRQSQQMVVLYVLLDAFVILVFGYVLLTRSVVRPVGTITAATARVASGDLTSEVEVEGASEIVSLAQSFNTMLERLRSSRVALEERVRELAAANEALLRARGEVRRSERLATVGQLAAGVAHEIGNPLSAIIGLLELMEDEDLLDAEARVDTLRRVQREIARIDEIVRGLVRYARGESAGPGAVDTAGALASASELFRHHQRGRAVRFDVVIEPSLPALWGSETSLVQVVLNLLLNASDATEGAGSITLRASRVVAEDGVTWVEIEVEDDGPGIAPEIAERIFDPFFTTKAPGQGTGLGLAMCERIVDEWGGEIVLDTDSGRGVRMRVRLPADAGPSEG